MLERVQALFGLEVFPVAWEMYFYSETLSDVQSPVLNPVGQYYCIKNWPRFVH
jgi:hypothetical protein